MRPSFLCLSVASSLLAAVPACSSATPASPVATGSKTTLPKALQAAHFTATLDPATNTLQFAKVAPVAPVGTLRTQSVDSISDPSGASGAPAAGNVDLVTPTPCTTSGSGASRTISCDVKLVWGATNRSLINPVVQIDEAGIGSSVSGTQTNNYDGSNSDGSNPLALGADHGLWVYTNSGESDQSDPVTGGGPYFLEASGTGYNSGTRTWILHDPDNNPVQYDVLVWASKTFSTYVRSFPASSHVDACSGGTSITSDTGSATLPFDFTIYNSNYNGGSSSPSATVYFARNGQLGFSSPLDASGTALDLPSTNTTHPSIWPFWDNLVFKTGGVTGQMCYKTSGSAPNRKFIVEWRDMDFADAPDIGSDLDFEVMLDEGTSVIETVYESMVAASGDTSLREEGSSAWVGLQNAAGSAAVGEYHKTNYGTGNGYYYSPQP